MCASPTYCKISHGEPLFGPKAVDCSVMLSAVWGQDHEEPPKSSNTPSLDIHLQVTSSHVWTCFSLFGNGISKEIVTLCWTFWDLPDCVKGVIILFYVLRSYQQCRTILSISISISSPSPPTLFISHRFDCSHPDGCEWSNISSWFQFVFPCWLMRSHFFMCLLSTWIFLRNVHQVPCPLFNWDIFVFLLLTCKRSVFI